VRWELRCDRPLARGELVLLGEGAPQPLPLEIDPGDPRVARLTVEDVASLLPAAGGLRKAETVSYRFRWTEREHGFAFEDYTRYNLEVVPDQPPVVTLVAPRPRGEQERYVITTRKVLRVTFEASDDYGLGRAWLAYRVNGEDKTRRHPLGAFPPGTRGDTFQAKPWALQATLPGLKVGDVLACEVEADDNRQGRGGPNVGRSRSLRLEVVSDEEYQRYVEREKAAGLDRTRLALKDELDSKVKVKELLPK
jgi:hypothetical protein